ncbi:MAG: nucleotidyl transferase AbiEii/AbiGii toxin family protein [Syntrophobacteraceae bacterium]|nr:nucleotidyl transferase AbiEii/AbiGii toxin family protein [Syntrophobacteraceae bacterium]
MRQRLLNLAREKSEAFDLVLTRYVLERLLYRIGRSEWRTKSLLKGAMLYALWHRAPYRPTRDMDLLAFGRNDIAYLMEVFRALCEILVEDDDV